MKRKFVLAVYVFGCFLETCQLSSLRLKVGVCIIPGLISASGHPANYDALDEYEEMEIKYDVPRTTYHHIDRVPTMTTKHFNPDSEWRLKGEYRIQCVEEAGVAAAKVINLISEGNWKIEDKGLKRWALCVLNKLNLMSKEGVFKMDVAMSKINKHDRKEAESIINQCLPTKPLPPTEIAWKYVKCHNSIGGNFTSISVF